MRMYACMYICMYVCMYVHICIYIYAILIKIVLASVNGIMVLLESIARRSSPQTAAAPCAKGLERAEAAFNAVLAAVPRLGPGARLRTQGPGRSPHQ